MLFPFGIRLNPHVPGFIQQFDVPAVAVSDPCREWLFASEKVPAKFEHQSVQAKPAWLAQWDEPLNITVEDQAMFWELWRVAFNRST